MDSKQSSRILITGASGFIGTHLARRLVQSGEQIVCLDLRPPRERLDGAQYLTADVRDLSTQGFGPIDCIYNLAAVHTTPGHADHEYYDTNINGAIEVVRLAERLGTSCIVFTSSISIYGPSEERRVETSRPAPVSAYGKSKLIAEKIHEDWQRAASGRVLTTVRPVVVFGQGEGGNFARMAALLRRGVFVFPGRRDTIKSCIYVEDLLDLVQAAQRLNQGHAVLNGAYPECPTLERIVTTLRDGYFPNANLLDVPSEAVILGAKVLSVFSGLGLGVHPERVNKLLRSTYVFPEWAAQQGLFQDGAFELGISRWAQATNGTFV